MSNVELLQHFSNALVNRRKATDNNDHKEYAKQDKLLHQFQEEVIKRMGGREI